MFEATLSSLKVVVTAFFSLAYFVSYSAEEVTRGTSSGADFREKPTARSFLHLLCNLEFIMWIQYSMEDIMRVLQDQKQFSKLNMYTGWRGRSLSSSCLSSLLRSLPFAFGLAS